MGRTTDEWSALLDGTTPGPWRVGGKDADGNTYVGNYDPDIGGPAASTGSDDAPLVAAAPDAVAEVVRLRREFEELREVFVRAAEMMGKLEIPADRQQAQGFAGRIARILEVTDE